MFSAHTLDCGIDRIRIKHTEVARILQPLSLQFSDLSVAKFEDILQKVGPFLSGH